MLSSFKNIFDNTYIQTAGLLALIFSPFADAIGGSLYWILSGFLFILFLFGLYDELKTQKKFNNEIIHIPIVIKVDGGTNIKYVLNMLLKEIGKITLRNNYELDLKKYHSIDIYDYIYEYIGDIYDFDRLMSFIRIIKYDLYKLEKKLDGRVKFHLAYYKKPSIGFIIGTLFRTEGLFIYQNNDAKNTFEQIADIKDRRYKENRMESIRYTIKESIIDTNINEILIIINSASHLVNYNALSLNNFVNTVTITLNSNGTIPYEDDWVEYASEIYSIINKLQTRYSKFTIAHAMPEALSIILGMALENYWDISITQYEAGEYKFIYNMKQIIYY